MAGRIDARLNELGIELPAPTAPKAAKILHYKRSGNLLYISGQVPRVDGEISFIGKVGREYSLAQGQEAARTSALCVLGAARAPLDGDTERHAGDADGGARMAPGIAEQLDEQLGRAVQHLRDLGEVGIDVDVALDPDDLLDAVEVAVERGARGAEHAERRGPRRRLALGE